MKGKLLLILFLFVGNSELFSQDCTNGRFLEPIFRKVDVERNIIYARKKQSNGQFINLRYDVYQPHGDTMAERPVMLLIHGGAYLKLLDQSSPDIVLLCQYFAKRGYVTVSIDYRQEANPLSLTSEETMVKAVSRALIDTKDAIDHLMNTYQNGNPYRLDTSKAVLGGVSAGVVSSMFITYLDSLAMMPQQYQEWIIDANGTNSDSILRTRFNTVKPKAVISISGALLDTNWVYDNDIDLLLVHGSEDEIVPYEYGYPIGIKTLPKLYGGKAIYPTCINKGVRCEFEDWIGRGHVPFFNLDIGSFLTFDFIDYDVLDSTERHIAEFCYKSLFNCSVSTGIKQNFVERPLLIYPNPSTSNFFIEIPETSTKDMSGVLEIFDKTGKKVTEYVYDNIQSKIEITHNLPKGLYILKLNRYDNDNLKYYFGRIIVN
jgi:acetyl esterase/lipase